MAFLQVDYRSELLQLDSSMNVIMPQTRKKGEKFPVLWLLHGFSGSHNSWVRLTALERYVNEIYPNLCVIMPAADHSFYSDLAHGKKYFTHLTEELPKIVAEMFPISLKREDTFIAGLSMGGYGAFKIGLSQPERFAAAVSLSGVLVVEESWTNVGDEKAMEHLMSQIDGELKQFVGSKHDIKHLTKKAFEAGNAPKLYFCCGEEDVIHKNNVIYKSFMDEQGLEYKWESDPGYDHEWAYWDLKVKEALKFFKECK